MIKNIEGLNEYLIREFGENFEDVIGFDWNMSVEDFCKMFIRWDSECGEFYSLV